MTEKHVTPLSRRRRKPPSVGKGGRAPQRRLASDENLWTPVKY